MKIKLRSTQISPKLIGMRYQIPRKFPLFVINGMLNAEIAEANLDISLNLKKEYARKQINNPKKIEKIE